MALCDAWGIPHSTFLEWDVDDQAKALAYRGHVAAQKADARRGRCVRCGELEADWRDPETGRAIPPHRRTRDVDLWECLACREAHQAKDGKEEGKPFYHVRFVDQVPEVNDPDAAG